MAAILLSFGSLYPLAGVAGPGDTEALAADEVEDLAVGQVLAEVGDEKITRDRLEQFRRSVRSGSPAAVADRLDSALLRALVDKTVLLNEADEQGIAEEPWLVRELARFRKNQLIAIYEYLEVRSAVRITEERLLSHFRATNRDRALRLSGIMLATEEEAEEVRAQLLEGADLAALARERSLHEPTREKGGDYVQYLKKDGTIGALHGLFAMQVGEISQPLAMRHKGKVNYAVIKVTDAIPVDIGDSYKQVYEELYEMELEKRRQTLQDSLRTAYAPRLTGRIAELSARMATQGEVDFSAAAFELPLCDYEGGRLTFGDFVTLVPEAHLKPEVLSRQEEVESLVRERAVPAQLCLEEVRRKTDGKPHPRVESAVARKREDLILSTVRKRGVDERIPAPTVEEARAYYEEHPEQFQTGDEVVVLETLVAFEELARQLRGRLETATEEEGKELARTYTIREGLAHHGGRLELTKYNRYPDLYDAALEIGVGQVAGPVRLPGGFSVFKVLDKRPSTTKPFNGESQRRATGYLHVEALRRGFVDYVRGLRVKYGVKVYD